MTYDNLIYNLQLYWIVALLNVVHAKVVFVLNSVESNADISQCMSCHIMSSASSNLKDIERYVNAGHVRASVLRCLLTGYRTFNLYSCDIVVYMPHLH